MPKIALSLCLGLFITGGAFAQNYLVSENFNNVTPPTLPSGWTSSVSGQWKTGMPDDIVIYGGFNGSGHESAVAINGRAVTANNAILETPTFSLATTASNAKLVFDQCYKMYLNNSGDTENFYLVVSTNGGNTWTQKQVITPDADWTTKTIDISSFAGQSNLKFGFKYSNNGGQLVGLALDNIYILEPGTNDIALMGVGPTQGSAAAYGEANSAITITGTVMNFGTSPISTYKVHYQNGNNPPQVVSESGNIGSFQTSDFNNVTFTIPSTGQFPLKVWVTTNGDNYHANDSGKAYIQGVAFMPKKRLVFEEATGTWCGWCPRGSVGMKTMKQQHANDLSLISVHNRDPMVISAYDSYITGFITGFPSAIVDRTVVVDPGPSSLGAAYNKYKNNFGFATVDMDSPTVSGNNVTVSVTIKPAVDINNAKIALVVTEDSVTGTGNGWPQSNYYAGGQSGAMGGYESLPNPVTDEVYYFVSRSITPNVQGGNAGLPATMDGGSTYTATLNTTLNNSWNKKELSYVVLLIGQDGKILNSDAVYHKEYATGIPNKATNISAASIYPNPTSQGFALMHVSLNQAESGNIAIFDLLGRQVYAKPNIDLTAGNNTIKLPTDKLSNGSYQVKLTTSTGAVSLKFDVVK